MSRARTFLYCLLLFLPSLASVTAQAPKPRHARHAKDQIAALEEQWRVATLSGDTVSMDRLLSDDYVGISWTGQVNTKATQIDRLHNRSMVIKSMQLSDMKIKVAPTIAIVTCRAEIAGTNDGNDASGAFRYTRIYERQPGGGWKITNFEATRIPPARHGRKDPPASS